MILDREIFLEGENVLLRQLRLSDVNGNYLKWLNDSEITRYNSHGRFPVTIEDLKKYVTSSIASNENLIFAVLDKDTQEHVGNISFQNINWIDRNAEIAFLLGEKRYWGKAIMFEAGRLIISHGFLNLNLHRIYCGTSVENIGMQKLASKLGMTQEGVRKEAMFKSGHFLDVIEYGLLSKDNGHQI